MDYTIRTATKEDMPAVLGLIKELAVFEKEPDAVEVPLKTCNRMVLVNTQHFIVLLPRSIQK